MTRAGTGIGLKTRPGRSYPSAIEISSFDPFVEEFSSQSIQDDRTWRADRKAVAVFSGARAGRDRGDDRWACRRGGPAWLIGACHRFDGLGCSGCGRPCYRSTSGGRMGRPGGQRSPRLPMRFWQIGEPVPIAVRDGRATFRVPTPGPTSEFLSSSPRCRGRRGPFPIRLTARSVDAALDPEPWPIDDPRPECRVASRHAALTTSTARSIPAARARASAPRAVFHHDGARRRCRQSQQLHVHPGRAQGSRPSGPGLCGGGRPG